jgi:hypothetical protein
MYGDKFVNTNDLFNSGEILTTNTPKEITQIESIEQILKDWKVFYEFSEFGWKPNIETNLRKCKLVTFKLVKEDESNS